MDLYSRWGSSKEARLPTARGIAPPEHRIEYYIAIDNPDAPG